MTASRDLGPRLPELMAELAPPSVPDYFDDLLRATERTPQRRSWTSLERWLPVEHIVQPVQRGLPSLRPILLLVAIAALLVAVGAVVVAGAKPALPAPFGLAKNGLILTSNAAGDVVSVDPATHAETTVIGGSTNDSAPWLSPDGQRFIFARTTDAGDSLYVANVDGSAIQEIGAGAELSYWNWSPAGDRIVSVREGGGPAVIVDLATGTRTTVAPGPFAAATWMPTGDRLLLVSNGDKFAFSLANEDGSARTQLASDPAGCCSWSLSPDGTKLAYMVWGAAPETQGRIHLLDIATGRDTNLTPDTADGFNWEGVAFSPDGKWLKVERFADNGGTCCLLELALLAADGSGSPILLGPEQVLAENGVRAVFSPDGTQLLATYAAEGSTWLFDIPGGKGEKLTWPGAKDIESSWQRRAP